MSKQLSNRQIDHLEKQTNTTLSPSKHTSLRYFHMRAYTLVDCGEYTQVAKLFLLVNQSWTIYVRAREKRHLLLARKLLYANGVLICTVTSNDPGQRLTEASKGE